MTLQKTTTVRDIAVEMPDAKRVFEKLGIDYCCGGGRSISEACVNAGVDIDEVFRSIEESARRNGSGGDNLPQRLTDLCSYIVNKHHIFTTDELARIDALLNKVCSVHGERHPELMELRGLFRALSDELSQHMRKEEFILFPYIGALENASESGSGIYPPPFGTVRNPIRMMSMEHDNAGDLLRKMRQVSSDYTAPADGCITYKTTYEALAGLERDLHEHIHLENNILFPRAIVLEDAAQ